MQSEEDTKYAKMRALVALCRDLFTRNLITSDFDDVCAVEVTKRDFPQQPGGAGVQLTFSVSWHAIGKVAGREAYEALDVLLPYLKDSDGEESWRVELPKD